MIDEINVALEAYEQQWQKLIAVRHERNFFASLTPTAVGWKVATQEEYSSIIAELHDQTDKIIETWMNGRWIATLHLKDSELANSATILKLMQRRSGSDDALGLDHVDFYIQDMKGAESILKSESDLQWSWENNDITRGYTWISIWFDGTEAKLKTGTVLGIIQKELHELNQEIIGA